MAFCADPLRLPCWKPVLSDGMVCDRCYAESCQHSMRYSAAVVGMSRAQSTSPGWECPCGRVQVLLGAVRLFLPPHG